MKLLRLKITDPKGFRSLPCGFEQHFRTEWTLQNELADADGFAPFVCAGPNGSGKSNLLEALAAIFFQLEVQRVRRSFLPESLLNDEADGSPCAYELEYLIKPPSDALLSEPESYAHVKVLKVAESSPQMFWLNPEGFASLSEGLADDGQCGERERDFLLPDYILGYSSGENEILSLPFFKMRFVQFDEYWNCLKQQLPYPGRPETRLAYLDNSFSQAIFLCNLLFQDQATLKPFREEVGIEALKEFRIVIRRGIAIAPRQLEAFAGEDGNRRETLADIVMNNPALVELEGESGEKNYRLNLTALLEGDEKSNRVLSALKRCATCWFLDQASDTLVLDYWVNQATSDAFKQNFDESPLALFQAFQVLLNLNLHAVSESLKAGLYSSASHYLSETVPALASDQRIMHFEYVRFSKQGVAQPIMLKELSDGEHQLLHSLGLCLLFRNANSLFLLDEPETHFNPDWRANFITRLRQCLPDAGRQNKGQEMLITTHTPFLISDSKPNKVLVFAKDKTTGAVSISQPDYNTLGASINKITMNTFGKRETIGGHAQAMLNNFRARSKKDNEDKEQLITEINRQLGDSVEKVLLIKSILDSMEAQS